MKSLKFLLAGLLIVVLVGCSPVKNTNYYSEKNEKENVFSLSKIVNWDKAKIIDIGYYPKFEEGAIVQNENYIFYPYDGNRIIRIDKSGGEQKIIMELEPIRGKCVSAQICLSEDTLFVEYEGDIYRCNFGGENVKKIISGTKLKEQISSLVNYSLKNDCRNIQGIKFYQGDLYLFLSSFYIVKFDLDTKQFIQVAKNADSGCFCNDALYYIDSYSTMMYKVDLATLNRVPVRGKKRDKLMSNDVEYFCNIVEADNQIYYLRRHKNRLPILYMYCEDKNDKKVYEYQGEAADFTVANNDLTRVVCEFHDVDRGNKYLQMFDIRTSVAKEIKLPEDFETSAFLAGDLIFYSKSTSDDKYLSNFKLK